jgi:hypothetical protein
MQIYLQQNQSSAAGSQACDEFWCNIDPASLRDLTPGAHYAVPMFVLLATPQLLYMWKYRRRAVFTRISK